VGGEAKSSALAILTLGVRGMPPPPPKKKNKKNSTFPENTPYYLE